MVDSHYLGYELSWEDSLLDGVDNFIHMVLQHTVCWSKATFMQVTNCCWNTVESAFDSIISSLTQIQPGKGRFSLTYMSLDYLHASHTGLPSWIKVNREGPPKTTL